ncbi:MAG: protein of unknown function DUF4059 [Chaetfec virus UA24_2329]|nr:MAG: protein of unknown function DUF4059 [Chaetfec virus UA24_2329]
MLPLAISYLQIAVVLIVPLYLGWILYRATSKKK